MRLDDVCDIVMGQAPDGISYNTDGIGVPLIAGAGDFADQLPKAKKFTSQAQKLSARGDIVLSIRASIGDKVWADGIYCLGRGVAALRTREDVVPGYLWHWLSASRRTLEGKARGATFKQVNRSDIGEMRISLPPLSEQRRIAEVLDRAGTLRAQRRQALVHLDALADSIFLDLFNDSDSKRWTRLAIGEVATAMRTGPFGSQLLHSEFVESGVAVLGIDNVVQNDFVWARPPTSQSRSSISSNAIAWPPAMFL